MGIGVNLMSFEENTPWNRIYDTIRAHPKFEISKHVVEDLQIQKENQLWEKYKGKVCKYTPKKKTEAMLKFQMKMKLKQKRLLLSEK